MKSDYCIAQVVLLVAFLGVALACPRWALSKDRPAAKGDRRVVAMYFHRTRRCPTCMKISTYTEEAVRGGFARQIKDGRVALHLIDFQNPKNRAYTKYYKITRPTLIVTDVRGGKVTSWKPLPKVWSLVFEKKKFLAYVQGAVRGYLEVK